MIESGRAPSRQIVNLIELLENPGGSKALPDVPAQYRLLSKEDLDERFGNNVEALSKFVTSLFRAEPVRAVEHCEMLLKKFHDTRDVRDFNFALMSLSCLKLALSQQSGD